MTLGLTDGNSNYGGRIYAYELSACSNDYGRTLPNNSNNGNFIADTKLFGITTDPTKSGIIVEPDTDIKLVIKY